MCCLRSVAQSCLTLCDPHDLKPSRLLSPWNSPGKDTGVGCSFLLQGIFLTQGLNQHLLPRQVDSSRGKPQRRFTGGNIQPPWAAGLVRRAPQGKSNSSGSCCHLPSPVACRSCVCIDGASTLFQEEPFS